MQSTLEPNNVLVLTNSQSPHFHEAVARLMPYLEHFGIPYEEVDLLSSALPPDSGSYPLIVLGHAKLDENLRRLGHAGIECLHEAIKEGTGLVSFDPQLSWIITGGQSDLVGNSSCEELTVSLAHWVTQSFEVGQQIKLYAPLDIPPIPGSENPLISSEHRNPLLSVQEIEKGRVVHWASNEWMESKVLGPLGGMDGLLWRSLVWAARKPFCLRGMPPLVTMRVDDVAGWGGLFDQSPLYWVDDAVRAGFKPWLGLFIYNLTPEAIEQLRGWLLDGQATAFPHALGRPARDAATQHVYYYQNSIPLRVDTYDEFIYFDHHNQRPWPDEEAQRGLDAVDRWYRENGPLPISRVALPHWYEMGSNTARHVREAWGAEFIGKSMDIDLPLVAGVPWLRIRPFRKFEETGECFGFTSGQRGDRAVYYADFVNLGGYEFFNSLTEIRDDYGYEWAPDNDVEASIARGIRQCKRAMDAMVPAVLFTHETDFIYKIKPENWNRIIQGVAQGIQPYFPVQMTLDDAYGYIRACRTAHFTSCRIDPDTSEILVTFEGNSDRSIFFYVFLEQDGRINEELREVPAFDGFLLNSYPIIS
jgi:hypothetical protein